MEEHNIIILNNDFNFNTKGYHKLIGDFNYSGIIPKGTQGTIVSDIKNGGCWVEFPSLQNTGNLYEDGVHWVEQIYLIKKEKQMKLSITDLRAVLKERTQSMVGKKVSDDPDIILAGVKDIKTVLDEMEIYAKEVIHTKELSQNDQDQDK